MNAPELKPSPFCGSGLAQGETTYTNASFSGVEFHQRGQIGLPEVYCSTCGAVGPPHEAEADAIAAWNARADLCDAQATEITRLRAQVDLLTKVERAAAELEAGLGEPNAKVGSLRVQLAAALADFFNQKREGGK